MKKDKVKLEKYFEKQIQKIDKELAKNLPRKTDRPARLHEAMRYSVLAPGKRIRPILVLAAAEAVGGKEKDVMPAAVALEYVHSYSLIHDDLPCMDDDDMRRGQPTCHKKFDEETALLAGDALLTQAFFVLSSDSKNSTISQKQLGVIRMISEAIGSYGMVGGQAVDLEFQKKEADLPTIEFINAKKSGALIAVATRVGAYLGGGSAKEVEAFYRYGKALGLLFQIVDDILDREGYAKVLGVTEARNEADSLVKKAKRELSFLGHKAAILNEITDFVFKRTY